MMMSFMCWNMRYRKIYPQVINKSFLGEMRKDFINFERGAFVKYRKLGNTGLDVSVLSYGASSLGSVFRDINEAEGIKTVHEAVDQGINLIDVSPCYGLTKAGRVLGSALKGITRGQY